jgi:hypothetical protein
LVIQGFT